MPPEEQLVQLIRARTPVVAVNSYEPERVLDKIFDVCKCGVRGKPRLMFTWTVTRGMYAWAMEDDFSDRQNPIQAGDMRFVEDTEPSDSPEGDTEHILSQIVGMAYLPKDADEKPNDVPAVYVLQDVHPYLGNPVVLRALRDVAYFLVKHRQTVILLSPSIEIPVDARKEVATIDWPLPDRDEISDTVGYFLEEMGDTIDQEARQAVETGLLGLTRNQADGVLAKAMVAYGTLDERAVQFVMDAKADIIRESGALEYFPPNVSLADVGGLENLKAWLTAAGRAQSQAAQEFGIKPPRGALTVGVPGCGKSLTAKMLSGLWNLPLVRLDVGALFGSLMGESEAQTRNALQVVQALGQCILWIDEIEKALGSSGSEMDGGTSKRVLGTILTWMEEHSGAGVFVFATANDIGALRPELIRRFSEVFFVDLPGQAAREEIVAIHLRKTGRDPQDYDVADIARACGGLTGSEIEEDVIQQGLWVALAEERQDTTEDFITVASQVVPLAKTMQEQIAKMRRWSVRAKPASNSVYDETKTSRKAPVVESRSRLRPIETA